MVLFTEQIFKNSIRQNSQPSICFKTRGRVQEKNQELEREFENFSKVFKKLVRVIKKLGHEFVI